MDFGNFDVRSLSKLFDEVDPKRHEGESSDSDTEECTSKTYIKAPGDIGDSKPTTSKVTSDKSVINQKDIWNSNEVIDKNDGREDSFVSDNISITNDPRKTPTYEMHYRQSMTTEDIFLQMGNKTPGTASCEDLVVEIHLPEEDDYQNVQLNLKKQSLDLRSPIHFLFLSLPHPIDTRAGNAKWNPDSEKLTITLKLSREFDDLNF